METFEVKGDYIQLNQLLKVMGWVLSGSEAHEVIDQGLVKVNGEIEYRRRNKIYPGFEVNFEGQVVKVK